MTSVYAGASANNSNSNNSSSTPTFTSIHAHLTTTHPPPLLPPSRPHDKTLTDTISSLYLHPTLEALLHILNADLPSAHFLCRKMQSGPAHEGMYIHGLLHRIESDYDNARAWYFDVQDSECFVSIWGAATEDEREEAESIKGRYRVGKVPAQKTARQFLDGVEAFKKKKEGVKADLERESKREIDGLVDWCVRKFGTERLDDATQAWVQNSDEIREIGQSMTTGDTGHRKF